ncbi:MAG: hypothetical protein IKN71_00135 [Alphaproteobacteria bacterium]|nr:hypothetical protein [Alphaproteobacteria bacterium]
MKKFETVITQAAVILLGTMAFGFLIAFVRQQNAAEYTNRMLKRDNRNLEMQVQQHDYMFGKYSDSVSDAMLRDFYPDVQNLDSLRNRLEELYEIKLRKDQDGLCY